MNYIDKSISGLADSDENINESGQSVLTDSPAGIMPFGLSDPVLQSRNILTNAPLTGGGSLEDDLTLGLNASSTAIANYVILRDANGRARVAAPSSASDIARKAEVDAVEERLDTVEFKIPVLSDAVNNASSLTGASSRAVKTAYDKAVSAENNSVPLIRNITTTAPLNGGGELNTDLALSINASSAATPNSVIQRDANGRAKVAAPSVASDIARKGDVDAVEERLDTVESRIPTLSDAVNSTSSTVAASSKAVKTAYDKAVAAEANSIASSRTISTAAPLTGGGDLSTDRTFGINASSAPTANYVIQRDANGRAKVAAPAAADDIARKAEVDALGAATAPLTRIIGTTAPLTGGGDLSGDRTLGLNASSNIVANYVIQRDDNGRAQVVSPLVDNDIATKSYVDMMIANAIQSLCTCDGSCGCKPGNGGENCGPDGTCNGSCGCEHGCDGHGNCKPGESGTSGESNITLIGATKEERLYGIIAIDDGYISCGQTTGSGTGDGLLIKFDKHLNVIGKTSVNVSGYIISLTPTNGGGCLCVGRCYYNDNHRGFVVAFDNNMQVVNQRCLTGGTEQCLFTAVKTVPTGFTGAASYIATGYISNGVQAYPMVAAYDKGYNLLKQIKIGNVSQAYFNDVEINSSGFVAVGHIGPLTATRSYDGLLVGFDNNMNIIKKFTISGTGQDHLKSIAKTAHGYVVAGQTFSAGFGGGDILIMTLDNDLNILKKVLIGGTGAELTFSIKVDNNGNYVVTGFTNSVGASGYNGFLVVLSPDLNIIEQLVFGGNGDEESIGLIIGADGDYVVTGGTSSAGAGDSDAFIASFNNDFSCLKDRFDKYPDILINTDMSLECKEDSSLIVNTNITLTVSAANFTSVNPNYAINYNPDLIVDANAVITN